jgi:AcrR family transcriptional regulator
MTQPLRRPSREDLGPVILKVAAGQFADRGFEGTTMQQIAAGVGITAAGLYYYFTSKQVLLFEVLEAALERMVDRVATAVGAVAADEPDRPVRELRAFTEEHARFQIEEIEETAVYGAAFYGSRFLLNALADEQRRRLRELQALSFDLLRRILRDGTDAGLFEVVETTATASAIVAMGEFAPSWFHPGGRLSADDVATLHGDLAVRMVGGT